jgi:phosphopantetheinyl transferase (holo-ACP synthase)
MLTFRLKNSLIPSEADSWKQLVTQSLGEDVHPKRALGFCLAREALRECLGALNIHLGVKDLVLKGFGQVTGVDAVQLSLSHSSDFGAAVVADASKIISVGIDLEPLSRVVKPLILARVSHPQDLDLSPLSIWALKEAIFKCLMNTHKFEQPLEFSSIRIGDQSWSQESGLAGDWKLVQEQGQLVALAWIKI